MRITHFVLVHAPTLRSARALALTALEQRTHSVTIADRRIPSGHKSAYAIGTPGFHNALQEAKMMQAASLLSVYTVLANTYGRATPKEFEQKYLHNPDEFKQVFANAFRFMGECAADVLLDRRCPQAVAGEDWTRGDFNHDGFLAGLDTMCELKKFLRGDYFVQSYFFNSIAGTAHILSDAAITALTAVKGGVLALVPVTIEG